LITSILVAIDGSEHSNHALNFALEEAAKWDARLVVLTVIPKTIMAMIPGDGFNPVYLPDYEVDVEEAYQNILNEAITKVSEKQPNIKFKSRLEKGRPADIILDVAKEEDIDLIVMGSRGLGGITGWILGSTSKHVVETCTKPILIVK